MENAVIYIIISLLGLCIGSFMNVLIYRIPRHEDFVRTRSHCMSCGKTLGFSELIPLVSYIAQGGKCRGCGAKLSAQYPMIEAANALMWLLSALLFAPDYLKTALMCLLFSALLVLSVIDWRTYIIPGGLSLAVFLLGLVRLFTDLGSWRLYLIGMVSVSAVFLIINLVTRGEGLGMGDVKLMAGAGLLLGWRLILLATVIGSVLGAVIHSLRMKKGAERRLAFGPYLSIGIWLSALFGDGLISAYLNLFGL